MSSSLPASFARADFKAKRSQQTEVQSKAMGEFQISLTKEN